MNQLISIIMPVKNAEAFLPECIESIIAQTEADWELIMVNDHSTDKSVKIMKKYVQKDSRIKYIDNKGEFISPALLSGYKKSKGSFIHRMDADDLMPKEKLSTLKKLLAKAGKDHIATGKVHYFAKGTVSGGFFNYQNWLNHLCEKNNHWEFRYKECVIASPNWLIHRSDFEKLGGFNTPQYPEDYDLVFRFYQAGLKVISSEEVTHHWRDHQNRSSRNLEVYKDNSFFDLKWNYFEQLDRDKSRPLMVWGAGPKGKKLVKVLKRNQINFQWVSNNPNKHGKEIYEQILASYRSILKTDNPQVIVAVAQRRANDEIKSFLESNGLKLNRDYFFFS